MFSKWLDTFIEEKELDTEATFEVNGPSGTNFIPLGCVVEAIKQAPAQEQKRIKAAIVRIDFFNGDVRDYFKHLAGAIAI